MLYSNPVQGDPDNYLSLLSAAQIETLRHVYEHKNSKQIARLMHVSPHTVDERVRRVLKKLNVSNRIEAARRSEEHTSELQSLMRISYAVFCLKKKNTQHISNIIKSNQP